MIDKIDQIALLHGDGTAITIFGDAFSDEKIATLQDMLQSRPAARKEGGGFVVSVPVQKKGVGGKDGVQQLWVIWRMDYVPTVVELPKILSNLATLSRGFLGADAVPMGGTETPTTNVDYAALEAALADLPARRRRNITVLTQRVATILTQNAQCGGVAVAAVRGGAVRGFWPVDDRLKPISGQLRAAYQNHFVAGQTPMRISIDTERDEDLEIRLILQQLGAKSVEFFHPVGGNGYGLMMLDASANDHNAALAAASAMLQLSRPMSSAPLLTQPRKRALLAAAALTVLWLAWPAPTWLTVTGTSIPDKTVVVSLPTDATLQQMFVKVGESVAAGAPIAQLFSAQLQERRSQEELSIKVEELAAQAAMSENDFGAFQLAEQRAEIAKTRLAQIEQRIAQLDVTAPVGGLIVSAVPDFSKGAALPQGTALAEVQTEPDFLVRLNPARVDARLMQVGQLGKIYFRGLSDRTYEMRMITPPVAVMDPETRSEKLEAYAEILTDDDGRLMGGLTGYARVAAPRQMRFLSLTRYIREYFRVTAWNYLGLPL